ncbi:hypothetical protein ACIRRH_35925 [Kitasatospora sp. NPDC101235]|uniref:hypothetical protein n=1 Tax=Kitasatospora sp. NPDC101235 TaxID=3364101 RepID=UPI0037F19076
MGFFSRNSGSNASDSTSVYRSEVDVTTADGQSVTYTATGAGPAGVPADQVTAGAVAAVRAADPTATVTAARSRTVK